MALMRSSTLIACHLLWIALHWHFHKVSASCDFPDFLQTRFNHSWRYDIVDQGADYNFEVDVTTNIMRFKSKAYNKDTFTQICVSSYEDNTKFLVAHEAGGQEHGLYSCLQFFQRSEDVIQMKKANYSRSMDRKICEDNMMAMDPMLMIDVERVKQTVPTVCPLKGGFIVSVYDKSIYQGVCDNYEGEVIIESECEDERGMTFYFSHGTCVPEDMYMRPNQRTLCLLTWQEGEIMYTLLNHPDPQYRHLFWVLQIPNNRDQFSAYLYKDLVTEQISHNWLRMDMRRARPVAPTQLCFDKHDGCRYNNPCVYSDSWKRDCPRKCKLCTDSLPASCSFDPYVQGTWRDYSSPGNSLVHINSSVLNLGVATASDIMHCTSWGENTRTSHGSLTEEEVMLVNIRDNGCWPRYTCAKILHASIAAMFVKISGSQRWPLTMNANNGTVSCSSFEYTNAPNHRPGITNDLQSRYYNPLLRTDAAAISCDNIIEFDLVNVVIEGPERCRGIMTQNNITRDGMMLNFSNCSQPLNFDTQQLCVDSVRFPPAEDVFIFTKSASSPSKFYCWLFPRKPRNKFYLFHASKCNEATRKKVRQNRVKPLATFTKTRRSDIIHVAMPGGRYKLETDPPTVDTGNKDFVDVYTSEETFPPKEDNEVLPPKTAVPQPEFNVTEEHNATSTNPVTDGFARSSPFLIAGVVLMFAIFQMPCWCKKSS